MAEEYELVSLKNCTFQPTAVRVAGLVLATMVFAVGAQILDHHVAPRLLNQNRAAHLPFDGVRGGVDVHRRAVPFGVINVGRDAAGTELVHIQPISLHIVDDELHCFHQRFAVA